MPEAVNPEKVVESVSIGNIKTVGEAAAHSMAVAMQNHVSHQNTVNALREASLGQMLNRMNNLDPKEAVSIQKTLTGNDLAQQVAQLAAAVASIQQTVKGAQTTPPVTP